MVGNTNSALTARDQEGVEALRRTLSVVDVDAASPPIEVTLPARLDEILGSLVVATRPISRERGWTYEWAHVSGPSTLARRAHNVISDLSAHDYRSEELAFYDPLRPQPSQRNRVVDSAFFNMAASRQMTPAWLAYERHGLAELSQIRVLLCDGPMLLLWLGSFRDEPFGARELQVLQSLVAPMRRRLRIERLLAGLDLGGEPFAAALDAIARPAFVVTAGGGVEHANAVGRNALMKTPRVVVEQIRSALARSPGGGASVVEISEKGSPARFVVALSESAPHEARIATARSRWALTPREVQVLEHLARGDANKDIATKLGCSPRTVELHVCELLRKAGTENRTQLALRFWGCEG